MKSLLFIFVFAFLNTLSFANIQLTERNILNEKQILQEKSFDEKSNEYIKKYLKSRKAPLFFLSRKTLKKYYKTFDYQLIWTNEDGVKDIAIELINSIKNDPVLKPHSKDAFRLNKIIRELNSLNTSPKRFIESMTKIDFMLTGVYNRYMWFLSRGYINWKKFKEELKLIKYKEEINSGWEKYSVRKDHKKLLLKAIMENDLELAFKEVNFTYPKSKELSNKIIDYEEIAQSGGYTKVPKSKALKFGKKSPMIKILRQRLLESNDLEANNCDIDSMPQEQEYKEEKEEIRLITQGSDIIENDCFELFDKHVEEAVISFQKRHGLDADGIVGPNTRKYLNIPVENKITQMRLNLERMRWMPRNLGEKFLVVNIPEYKLKMYDEEKIKLDMRIVVGKRKHPTPIFSHKMSFIVINPYWKIPNSIVTKEIIPKMIKEPDYLSKTGINVHQTWDINSDILDSNSINWSLYIKEKTSDEPTMDDDKQSIDIQKLPIYRFIQVPSDTNPLGRIKFMFPNRFSVYLHDSPAKHIFEYDKRAYSHGCVRLAEPKKLLEAIASSDINVDYGEANKLLEEIDKTRIELDKKIPVHMVYLTSWIDENGLVQFRDDIYKYDEIQKELLYENN